MPKVTVYIPTHNYGKYIEQAVQSVLCQTMDDWELIIIDDGSTDNTQSVLDSFRSHPKIRIVEQTNQGLNVTNNIALRLATGSYLMRLDADDYLDENTLLILSNILDIKDSVGLVYPDYYLVDDEGEILEVVRRKKIGEEVQLLDLPAHGACTMIRREILLEVGGYYEEFNKQDGYGLWLKFIRRYQPDNVNIPLFYYRQHGESLTVDKRNLLQIRGQVKRRFMEEVAAPLPKVLGLVPIAEHPSFSLGAPFTALAGKSLIAHTLDEIVKAKLLDRVVVSSSSQNVLDFAGQYPNITSLHRPKDLTKLNSPIQDTITHVLESLKRESDYVPDAICICYINHPFRRAEHIDRAIDTLTIFQVDSVISIQEELSFCYHHGQQGLFPINGSRDRSLRLERKAIFKENGAIYLTKVGVVQAGMLLGDRLGHITMLPEESVTIKSQFDFWVAENILTQGDIPEAVSSIESEKSIL
jgi:CMP-N-acetylneuraminic acid synthetase